MWKKAAERLKFILQYGSYWYITQDMHESTVERCPYMLKHVL